VNRLSEIRSVASHNRRCIFKILLELPHDEKYLAYLVTQKAKDLGLVNEDRKNLKGHTLKVWSNSRETDGRNAANAWACTASVRLILDYKISADLSETELETFAYYLSCENHSEDALFQAKELVRASIIENGKRK